jgi:hypothetical protein
MKSECDTVVKDTAAGRDHLGHRGVYARVILKWRLKKNGERLGNRFSCIRIWSNEDYSLIWSKTRRKFPHCVGNYV